MHSMSQLEHKVTRELAEFKKAVWKSVDNTMKEAQEAQRMADKARDVADGAAEDVHTLSMQFEGFLSEKDQWMKELEERTEASEEGHKGSKG